jgi:hypothetical protein
MIAVTSSGEAKLGCDTRDFHKDFGERPKLSGERSKLSAGDCLNFGMLRSFCKNIIWKSRIACHRTRSGVRRFDRRCRFGRSWHQDRRKFKGRSRLNIVNASKWYRANCLMLSFCSMEEKRDLSGYPPCRSTQRFESRAMPWSDGSTSFNHLAKECLMRPPSESPPLTACLLLRLTLTRVERADREITSVAGCVLRTAR